MTAGRGLSGKYRPPVKLTTDPEPYTLESAGLDKPTGRPYAENAEKDRRWQQHKLSERD